MFASFFELARFRSWEERGGAERERERHRERKIERQIQRQTETQIKSQIERQTDGSKRAKQKEVQTINDDHPEHDMNTLEY